MQGLSQGRRYYFDIDNGQRHRDNVGEDLAGDEMAWQYALRLVRDIEDVLTLGSGWCLQVRTEETPLFRIKVLTERVSQGDVEVHA